jgi:glutathione S-transferase
MGGILPISHAARGGGVNAVMLTLYDYAASANCYKVRLLLAQLGTEYRRVPIDIFAGDTLDDAYRARNPTGQTPVLETEDGEVVFESAAILWYLAEGTPFLPESRLGRARTLQWLSFEQEQLMNGIGGARFRALTGREALNPELVAARRALGAAGLDVLDGALRGREFLVEDRYSIADIAAYGYVHVAEEAGLTLAERPEVVAWLARVAATPGFMNDLEPYPENARPGAGRSIYD